MILIADLHFGGERDSYMVGGIPVQRRDLCERLYYVGNLCRDTDQALVIAGDVFNKLNPTCQVIEQWFKFLSNFSTVPIFVIPGNHDSGTSIVNMGMVREVNMEHVTVFTKPSISEVRDSSGGSRVLFYPHIPLSDRDTVQSIATLWGDADFAVTHGQVQDSEYQNDIFFEAGDALSIDMQSLDGLIFSGHIHNQKVYSRGRTRVVYPGSMTINNFGEVDEAKGYITVPLDDPSNFQLNSFPDGMGARWQHVELDLTDRDETMLDEDAIRDVAEDALIKVTVLSNSYGVVDEIAIRRLFNKYGTVVRYETKVVGAIEKKVSSAKKVSHSQLLSAWLSDCDAPQKDKRGAKLLGDQLIAKVLS